MLTPSEVLDQINSLKAELDRLRPLDRELEDRVLQKFRLWWTYHSNAIEGNKLTQGETEMFLMEGLTAKGKPLKDHLDLQGHSNAINYLLAFVREGDVLTESMIRKLHEVLLVESYKVPAVTPDGAETSKMVRVGEYKIQPNHVRTPTGEIHYYATPLETPIRMQKLIDWQRRAFKSTDVHPVEICARFHHEFTAIHPFDDGNGRMARLLTNLLLMQKGYPPVVIRLSERDEYLRVLREADQGNSSELMLFIAKEVAASLELYLRAARGEEIHEPSDIEKEIALLKIELKHVEDPVPLSGEIQGEVISKSVGALYSELHRLLEPLLDLFSESSVVVYGSVQGRAFRNKSELRYTPKLSDAIGERWSGGPFGHLQIEFELTGFKKAGVHSFDVQTSIAVQFQNLKYVVESHASEPRLSIAHLYQHQLDREERARIAQSVGRFFLDTIRKNARALS